MSVLLKLEASSTRNHRNDVNRHTVELFILLHLEITFDGSKLNIHK